MRIFVNLPICVIAADMISMCPLFLLPRLLIYSDMITSFTGDGQQRMPRPRKVAPQGLSTTQKVVLGGGLGMLAGYGLMRGVSSHVGHDLFLIKELFLSKRFLFHVQSLPEYSVADFFATVVKAHPNSTALQFIPDDGSPLLSLTYTELDERSNQIANWAIRQGISPGEVVAFMYENSLEFVMVWLAMAKIGAITALINHNLRGGPLLHSLSICKSKWFLLQPKFTGFVDAAMRGKVGGRWFSYDTHGENGFHGIQNEILAASPAAIDPAIRKGRKVTEPMWYVYTSGTTGLPKAARVTHLRFLLAGIIPARTLSITSQDKVYTTLPLYHSAGGMLGTSTVWYAGASMLIRRKFSTKSFFEDCAKYGATIVQYIGELCRYLLQSPNGPYDRAHKVRMALGNGLRPDVWGPFQERFNIPQIGEFYAATEGNVGFFNTLNKKGAVGYMVPLISRLYPGRLVKFDTVTEMPIRDKNGFCIPCKAGEVGEMIGYIDESDPLKQFSGYTDKKATDKKVLCDVFQKGDRFFRTGDLMKQDSHGFVYFVDRIGDTFRWKGENVATTEVAEVLNKVPGIIEANVYGVQVPHHDGRAGMASLIIDSSQFDVSQVYAAVRNELPSYAAPLFLRISEQLDTTSTFKNKKNELVKQGFDPQLVKSPIYYRDDGVKSYRKLTEDVFSTIQQGTIKSKL